MFDYSNLDYFLIGANIIIYSLFGLRLLGRPKSAVAGARQAEAFATLINAIKAFPGVPTGFTLKEGLAEVRKLGLGVNWEKVETETDAYESHRYGGAPSPPEPGEVLALVRELEGLR